MAGRQTTKSAGKGPEQAAAEEPTAGEYAREAAAEWGRAIKLAAGNFGPRLSSFRGLFASSDGEGGRVGDVADKGISKFGRVGSLAAKAGVGSRVVERLRPDPPEEHGEGEEAEGGDPASNGGGTTPIPIQESIRVAVPVEVAYRLATTYQDYPAFIDRVKSAEERGSRTLELVIHARGADHRLVLQFEKVLANRRIDWRCEEEVPHLGMVTFHELAPRLTHIEVSIDREPSGLVENLNRRLHLTDRVLHGDLQRFKAYAELWEDPDQEEAEPEAEAEEEPEAEGTEDDESGGAELDDQEIDSEEQAEAEAEAEPAGVD